MKYRFKRISISSLLLFIIILAAVVVTIIADNVEENYNLRKDYSFNQYTTSGEETKKAISLLKKNVEIYVLDQSQSSDLQLLELLKRYENMSSLISVEKTNLAQKPSFVEKFPGTADNPISSDSVIISCNETGRYRLYSPTDFLSLGYDIEAGQYGIAGISYEKKITEAILYVSQDNVPTVQILSGHGELSEEGLETFTSFLEDNLYQIKNINIATGDVLEDNSLLFICAPQIDLSVEEVKLIKEFSQNGGNILISTDYTDPTSERKNFNSMLESYGIVPLEGLVVADEEDTESYYDEPMYILPYMQTGEWLDPLISANIDVLLMPGASAFEINQVDGVNATPLLTSGESSYIRNINDTQSGIEKQTGDITGKQNLAVLSQKTQTNGNVSKLVILGNTTMYTDSFMYQRTFVADFMLQILNKLLPEKAPSINIEAKPAFRPELKVGSKKLGLLLVTIVPLILLIVAFIVLKKRRNL